MLKTFNAIISNMARKKGSKNIPKVKVVEDQIDHLVIEQDKYFSDGRDGEYDPSIKQPKVIAIQTGDKELTIVDPQTLFNNLLEANNLKIDFDVIDGTIPTQFGIIKLEKPTLVIKASYVQL